MSPKRIVLTGASGYLGQHLLHHWMHNECFDFDIEVVALCHSSKDFARVIQGAQVDIGSQNQRVKVIPHVLNLTDAKAIQEETLLDSVDLCIHAAAMSSPRLCQQDPDKARAVNVPTAFLDCLLYTSPSPRD